NNKPLLRVARIRKRDSYPPRQPIPQERIWKPAERFQRLCVQKIFFFDQGAASHKMLCSGVITVSGIKDAAPWVNLYFEQRKYVLGHQMAPTKTGRKKGRPLVDLNKYDVAEGYEL